MPGDEDDDDSYEDKDDGDVYEEDYDEAQWERQLDDDDTFGDARSSQFDMMVRIKALSSLCNSASQLFTLEDCTLKSEVLSESTYTSKLIWH